MPTLNFLSRIKKKITEKAQSFLFCLFVVYNPHNVTNHTATLQVHRVFRGVVALLNRGNRRSLDAFSVVSRIFEKKFEK